jgi:hypothetical protein
MLAGVILVRVNENLRQRPPGGQISSGGVRPQR